MARENLRLDRETVRAIVRGAHGPPGVPKLEDVETLDVGDRGLLLRVRAAGELGPIVDRSFSLPEGLDATRYRAGGRARGKVVVAL